MRDYQHEDKKDVRNEPEGPPHQWMPDEVKTEALPKEKMGWRGYQCGKDQLDAEVAALPRGFCFQCQSSPECPKAKRVSPPKSNHRDSPRKSLKATMSEETEPGP